MIIYLIALFMITLIGSKIYFKTFNPDPLSRETTTSIKGFFAVMIFESHVREFITLSDKFYDTSYVFIINHIGQLMVVMFLFYSGYGIITQFKKRTNYFESFPKNRILKTYLHLPVLIILFILTNLCLGTLENYSTKTILLSLTGWTAIGNSNWFLFSIIIAYILVYLASILTKDEKKISFVSFIFITLFSIVLSLCKPICFYNTILSLPAGMLFACYKEKFENIITKNNKNWFFSLLIFIFAFTMFYVIDHFAPLAQIPYNFESIAFALIIVTLSYKIKIGNKLLLFLGINALAIYLLQRIPMMFLSATTLVNLPIIFTLCTLTITIAISYGYTLLFRCIDKKLFQ